MATFSWTRDFGVSLNYQVGSFLLARIPFGDSYDRVRIRWGFTGDSSATTDLNAIAQNILSFGLVTVKGNGTETPPNARTQSGNVAPPTQRWLYWETRGPVMSAVDVAGNLVAWRDAGSSEPTETRAQVLAPIMIVGQQLDLWASWAAASPWDTSGSVCVWVGFSILVRTPLWIGGGCYALCKTDVL